MCRTFRSYTDESGSHNGARFCVIAGYVGRIDAWKGFERDWREVLDKYQIRWFHAKEFLPSGRREFRPVLGWSDDKKRRILDELINVINARPVCLVASAVDTELFWRLTLDERRQFTGGRYDNRRRTWVEQGKPNAPYFLAFHHCIKVAGGLVPEGETLLPVFAEHPDYKIKAYELYPAIRNDPRLPYSGRLAEELAISSPRTVAMLQAADLAAYGFYQFS